MTILNGSRIANDEQDPLAAIDGDYVVPFGDTSPLIIAVGIRFNTGGADQDDSHRWEFQKIGGTGWDPITETEGTIQVSNEGPPPEETIDFAERLANLTGTYIPAGQGFLVEGSLPFGSEVPNGRVTETQILVNISGSPWGSIFEFRVRTILASAGTVYVQAVSRLVFQVAALGKTLDPLDRPTTLTVDRPSAMTLGRSSVTTLDREKAIVLGMDRTATLSNTQVLTVSRQRQLTLDRGVALTVDKPRTLTTNRETTFTLNTKATKGLNL